MSLTSLYLVVGAWTSYYLRKEIKTLEYDGWKIPHFAAFNMTLFFWPFAVYYLTVIKLMDR